MRTPEKRYVHGDKSTPQGADSIFLHGLGKTVDKAVVDLLVGGLVHQIGSDSIKGRDGASHEKSGDKTGTESGADILS